MASFIFDLVDENEASIDCKGIGYYVELDTKSGEYSSEEQQMTMDIEDSSWCGSGTAFPDGDHALHHYYTSDKGCCFVVTSDGGSDYTGVAQLKPSQPPTTVIDLPETGTVNVDVNVTSDNSDEHTWSYNGITFYHKASMYGITTCDFVGIDTVEYDWGDGFVTDTVHQFTEVGDYDVTVKVTNKNGQETEDTATIRIKYNEPIITLSNDPVNPSVNEDTTVTIDVDDPDSQETDRKYYIDDVETTDTAFNWDELGDHVFKCTVYWNDGFEDQEVSKELLIEMTNQPPTLDMSVEESTDGDGKWKIVSGAVDPEDNLDRVGYWLYVDRDNILDPNDDNPDWILIETGSVTFDLDMEIFQNGDYKVEMIAYDGDGEESTRESVEFTETDLDGAVAAECEKLEPNDNGDVTADDPVDNGDGTSTTKSTTADGLVVYVTTDNDSGDVVLVRNEGLTGAKVETEDEIVTLIDDSDNETAVDIGSTSSVVDSDTGDVTVTTVLSDGTELEVVYNAVGEVQSGKFTDEDGTVTDMVIGDSFDDSNGNTVGLNADGMSYAVGSVSIGFNEKETVIENADSKTIVYPETGESMVEYTDGQRALVQADGAVIDETFKYTVLIPDYAAVDQMVTLYVDGKFIYDYQLTQDDIDAGSVDILPIPQPRLDETVTFRINDSGSGGSTSNKTGGDTIEGAGVYTNVGYNMFGFTGVRHSWFDIDASEWVNDDDVDAKASDLAKALCSNYSLVWDDQDDDNWIGNYISYIRSYDDNAKKFRLYKPSKTPETNDANFQLIIEDEDGNVWVRGVSVLLIQSLETISDTDGATIPFRSA